jgi:hypothetical protein
MKKLLFITLLLSGSLLFAQNGTAADNDQSAAQKDPAKGQITVTGCVSQFSGDYTLIKENPAITYELQATGKTRLKDYLGHRVEVTGWKETSLSTSSDAMAREGSPSPLTIKISSIKTIDKDCSQKPVSR